MASTEVAMTFLVWVPVLFWDDHVSRDLDFTTKIIKQSGKRYQILVTIDALNELVSDARSYASFEGEEYQDNRSVVNSARSTLKALKKEGWNV